MNDSHFSLEEIQKLVFEHFSETISRKTLDAFLKELIEQQNSSPLKSVNQTTQSLKMVKAQEETKNDPTETVYFEDRLDEREPILPSLIDRYEILEILGEGGMGVVQRVQDQRLHREVALKQIKMQSTNSNLNKKEKNRLWRLQNEVFIMAKLEHPNIVPLYDMETKTNGEFCFTMRRVEGKTLGEILKEKAADTASYSEDHLLSIFLKICDAVSYAHSKQIIHRDLKPDNIMVGQFGEVYVMDWGIAKELIPNSNVPEKQTIKASNSDTPETKEPFLENFQTIGGVGTPGYMPPEQRRNASQVTPASDIYALGKILKQLFTYLSPLDEFRLCLQNYQDKELQVLKKENKKQKNSLLPKDIQAIVEKATEEEEKQRYNSAQEIKQDIEHYLKNFRISVREYGFIELCSKWANRNKKSLFIASFSILFVTFLLFSAQWISRQNQLKEHQQKLNNWLKILKDPQKIEKKMALLEISKMREQEIFQQLISMLKEGTNYFLSSNLRHSKQDEFYNLIVEIIGSLENPQAGEYLLTALEQMKAKLAPIPHRKRPSNEILYMITLTQALQNSKAKKVSLQLYEIRKGMDFDSLYSKKTKDIYVRLGLEERMNLGAPSEAQDYYNQGTLNMELTQFREAIPQFTKVIQLKPDSITGYNNRGYCWMQLENYENAIADFKQTISLNPNYSYPYHNLGLIFKRKKQYKKALDYLTKAIEQKPNYFLILLNRGLVYADMLDFKSALKDYNTVLELNPRSPTAYESRGKAWTELGKLDLALKDFERAIQLEPKNYILYKNRGVCRYHNKDFRGAIDDLNKSIQEDPQDFETYNFRGTAKLALKDFTGAIHDYNESLRLNPSYGAAYNNRGRAKIEQKDYEGAIKDYKEGIKFGDSSGSYLEEAYLNRGIANFQQNRIKEAIIDFSKTIEFQLQNPRDSLGAEAYWHRAGAKIEIRDFPGAIKDCQQAILLNPKKAHYYNMLGKLFFETKAFAQAIEALNHSLKLDPSLVQAYGNRGLTKASLKKYDEAIQDFSQLLLLDPKDVDGYNNRGLVKFEKGDFSGAIQDYTKSIGINPHYPDTYNYRGLAKNMQKSFPAAIEDFQKASKLYSEMYNEKSTSKKKLQHASVYFNMGGCYFAMQQQESGIKAFEKGISIKKDPRAVNFLSDMLLQGASQAYRKKEYQKALDYLLRFEKNAPQNHSKRKLIPKMKKQVQSMLDKKK